MLLNLPYRFHPGIYVITLMISGFIFTHELSIMAQDNTLKPGDTIPDFTLPDQDGKEVSIKDLAGTSNLVIYFYPKDETPGCTKEACSFRDAYEEFEELGARVIGISADDVASHKKFKEHHKLPFTLLSDRDNRVRRMFGVPKFALLLPGRVTYIIDKNRRIVHVFNSMMQADKHVEKAIKVLKSLESKS